MMTSLQHFNQLADDIKRWAKELGFQDVGITDCDLSQAEERLKIWLAKGYHGKMDYMAKHGTKRTRPDELVPGTMRIISVRMDYLPPNSELKRTLKDKLKGYIARYALGRDYHKVIRKRLQKLADTIEHQMGEFGYRVFTDSAPVMEKPIAEKAGLGWIGKNTLLLNKNAGSWFLIGEIFTDLPLPTDQATSAHCGSCQACLDICPTGAIVEPYQLDARKCISYLTIEYKGSIPEWIRPYIGNRIFGCDDCQIICPWNRFAKYTQQTSFLPRHELHATNLVELFLWDESTFLAKTQGSPLRRTGFEGWLRNIAIALGNAPTSQQVVHALHQRRQHSSELVREHVHWALARHNQA
jgi:epoxyqueuosine reductase